jgi:hypothetical protein
MSDEDAPKRRWYQFYLSHLFVFVTLFAVLCSAFAVDRVAGIGLLALYFIVFGNMAENRLRRNGYGRSVDICLYVVLVLLLVVVPLLLALCCPAVHS